MKPSFLNKKTKGFTMLEVILAMAISLVILSVIAVLMGFSLNILKTDFEYNKKKSSISYAQSYIEKEISRSYKVYEESEFPQRLRSNNLGFVIEILPYKDMEEYSHDYVYYYLNNDKLQRVLYSSYLPVEEEGKLYYQGTNTICENVESIDKTFFDRASNYIELNFSFDESGINKESTLGIFVEGQSEED